MAKVMFLGGVLNHEPTIFRGLSAYDCARQTLKSRYKIVFKKSKKQEIKTVISTLPNGIIYFPAHRPRAAEVLAAD